MRPSIQQLPPAAADRRFLPLRRGLALGVACALAMAGCDGGQAPQDPPPVESALPDPARAPSPEPADKAPEAPVPPEIAGLPPRYQELHRMLESRDVLMEWKHEIVLDDLAPDPSSEATSVLIVATKNTSIPVSMASLKALANRMDDRVEARLVTLLEDDSWERRAWSARILGQTGRRDALDALTELLPHETDTRVRRQIEQAVAALATAPGSAEASGTARESDVGEPGEAGG